MSFKLDHIDKYKNIFTNDLTCEQLEDLFELLKSEIEFFTDFGCKLDQLHLQILALFASHTKSTEKIIHHLYWNYLYDEFYPIVAISMLNNPSVSLPYLLAAFNYAPDENKIDLFTNPAFSISFLEDPDCLNPAKLFNNRNNRIIDDSVLSGVEKAAMFEKTPEFFLNLLASYNNSTYNEFLLLNENLPIHLKERLEKSDAARYPYSYRPQRNS